MGKSRKLMCMLMVIILCVASTTVSAELVGTDSSSVTRVSEVMGLRETNSETYLMSDGSYQCVIYAEDKYFLDEEYSYQVINNSIVRDSAIKDGLQYRNKANAFNVTFANKTVPAISFEYKGTGFSFSPESNSGQLGTATTAGNSSMTVGTVRNCDTLEKLTMTGENTVTYTNVFPNTDLVYVLGNNALKEYIILNNSSSPNEFTFTFHLNGLTLQSINGNCCFMDSSGEEMFSLAPLFAIDAVGELTQDVFYEILPGQGKNEVTVKVVLDNDYLSDPDRIFPIVVDPSIMMSGYSNIYDTYVTERYPTLTNGAVTYLRTGRDTDFYTRRSYIRFVLPTYIDGDNVTSAYINLKKYSGATPAITAYRVLSSWDSNTLTWNNRPNYTTANCSATASLVSDNWYRAYVTNIVKGWLKGTTANYGFMIRDAVETNTDQWTTFYSSEGASPNKPELIINYTTTRPIITRDLVVYKNSAASVNLSDLNNYIAEANSIFTGKFNISFNRLWSGSSSALNQRAGCAKVYTVCCDSNCGALNACKTSHHKSGLHFLYIDSSSTSSTVRFVDYATCYYDSSAAKHNQCYGLSDTDNDVLVSLRAPTIQRTTCHELAHCFGARDNVCTPGESCVMTYDSNVTNKWCSQCTQDILNYLDSRR